MIISGRFSFVNVFVPKADLSGRDKFSVQILIPKSDTATLHDVREEIARAIELGVSRAKFQLPQARSAKFKNPLRDGDEHYADSPCPARESGRGHFFINANNTEKPDVVDRFGQPVIDASAMYSGCYGLADVSFFPFNSNGSVGIGASLQNVMKKRDGERLDGKQSANAAFDRYIDDPSAEEMEAANLE